MKVPSFAAYINESRVSEANLRKMVTLFMKFLSRRLQGEYTVYSEMEDIKGNGKGLRAAIDIKDRLAILRFNWFAGAIDSISIWDDFATDSDVGDRTVFLNGLSIIQVAEEILDIVKKPSYFGSVTKFPEPVYESTSSIKRRMVSEAVRKKINEFAAEMAASGFDITRVTWDDMASFASKNDYTIPSAVKSADQTGKGKERTYNLQPFAEGGVTMSSSDNKTDYIAPVELEVAKFDKLTIKGIEIDVPDHLAMLVAAVDSKAMTDEEFVNATYEELLEEIEAVARGFTKSLLVVGGPGLGKTFSVTQHLKKFGWNGTTVGRETASTLFRKLFINRNPEDILVFDEADGMFDDNNAVNLLKVALNNADPRYVSYNGKGIIDVSKMTPEDIEKITQAADSALTSVDSIEDSSLPSTFQFKGKCIFISNMRKNEFNSAILSRSSVVDMDFTPQQVFIRMKDILDKIPGQGIENLSKEEKIEVLTVVSALYNKELEIALEKWNNEASASKKKLLVNPKDLLPSIRLLQRSLEFRALAKELRKENNYWVSRIKKAIN